MTDGKSKDMTGEDSRELDDEGALEDPRVVEPDAGQNAEETARETERPPHRDKEGSEEPAQTEDAAALKDQLLRAVAEAENTRRRAERQVKEASQYAVSSFAREMLTISDNLKRAIESLPDGVQKNEEFKAFVDGVTMTERELLKTLERHGIQKIDPLGEPFDHNFHQAMFEVEDSDATPGTVVQVVQSGYTIRDRLLRPALVGVAKAPRKSTEGVDTTV